MIRFGDKFLFAGGGHRLSVGSWQRQQLERGFAGLNGSLSMDLGGRQRKMVQTGELIATSRAALDRMANNIRGCIDGQSYELTGQDGTAYDNVRMDSFALVGDVAIGSKVSWRYEIGYSQLG